jgi:hypothetical protein
MGYAVNDNVGVGVRVQDFAVDLDGCRFADSEVAVVDPRLLS